MRAHTALWIACLCALGVIGSACGEDPKPKPSSTASAATKKAAPDAGAATETDLTASSESAVVYQYNPMAKRDPFRSPDADTVRDTATSCTEPLCQWELDQLTLVGVVSGM